MPYDRQIPDAPLAVSMLPRLADLQDTDLIYVMPKDKRGFAHAYGIG